MFVVCPVLTVVAAAAAGTEFGRLAAAAAGDQAHRHLVDVGRAAMEQAQRRDAALQRQRDEVVAEQLAPPAADPEPVDDFDAVSSDDEIEPPAVGIGADLADDGLADGMGLEWDFDEDPAERTRYEAQADLHRNRGGRPTLAPPPLADPAWLSPLAGDKAPLTLQQLMDQLVQLQHKHNGSHALFTDLFGLLRDVLPKDGPTPRLPEYRRVRELMSESAHGDTQEFALCPSDCSLQRLAGLDAAALKKLKESTCETCGQKYSENGKEFDKVRNLSKKH